MPERFPGSIAVRGKKRPADDIFTQAQKRICSSKLSGQHETSEEEDNPESDDESHIVESVVTTPLTLDSPSSAHKHPSDARKIHKCTFQNCEKVFNRPAKLAQHIRSHTNERPFVCPYTPCTKDFLRESHLAHHIKSAHTGERDYACHWEGCQKKFLTATRLKRHLAGHEGSDQLTCKVEGCGQVFRKHSTLLAHVEKVHEGKKPHTCAFMSDDGKMCGIGFDTAGQLRSHEGRIHHRNTFECTICSTEPTDQTEIPKTLQSAFSTYRELQDHISSQHPPTCEECGYSCASKAALKSHMEVRHGNVDINDRRIHLCPEKECGAAFTKKGNLNIHVRTVHNHQRYTCTKITGNAPVSVEGWDGSDACGLSFAKKYDLIAHVRTSHLGQEPHVKRRNNKKKNGRRSASGIIAKITGTQEDEEEGGGREGEAQETYPCVVRGCNAFFWSKHEHGAHLQSRHGLADSEIQSLTGQPPIKPIYGRPDLQGGVSFATEEDIDMDRQFDLLAGRDASRENVDGTSHQVFGDGFWLGGLPDGQGPSLGEWHQDELGMRYLIDEEDGSWDGKEGQFDEMEVDPLLL